MAPQTIPVLIVTAFVLLTIGLGVYGTRLSRTTSDFYVAGRGVNAFWNSSAISGEYLSAASFMGIAGMVMKHGYDALWYPVGYAAGFLVLLVFIVGPLRRFGAYTIPDFAEGRLDSRGMRRLAVIAVLCISVFYMLPQLKGAGLVLGQLFGTHYWVGVVVVGGVTAVNVILGGMKGITLVQAFQYWFKAFAIMVPVFVLMAVTGTGYSDAITGAGAVNAPGGSGKAPLVREDLTTTWPHEQPITFTSDGVITVADPVSAVLRPAPTTAVPDPSSTRIRLAADRDLRVREGETLVFDATVRATLRAGTTMPNVVSGSRWLAPYGSLTAMYGDDYSVLYTYSLAIALLCGTAGLPHILVRFYTNTDAREAKRTTLAVIVLLSLYYVFPAIWGALGRLFDPSLYANGSTDLVTVLLPERIMSAANMPLAGQALSGIAAAGACAAFMTTFSGLLMTVAAAFSHDVYARLVSPNAKAEQRLTAFRAATAASATVAIGLALLVAGSDINMLVGWAFAIAASTFFPLLLLGSWYRNLTATGAAAGMIGGGLGAIGSVVYAMVVNEGAVGAPSGLVGVLTAQPAIWTVPLSISLMLVVSRMTKGSVPADAGTKMLKLHAPEQLGLESDYVRD